MKRIFAHRGVEPPESRPYFSETRHCQPRLHDAC
jgi:hypothetical protein